MCHPEASSMREEEEIARGNIQSIFRVEDMSDAYDIDLTKCKELSILGGEPSIDLEVRKWIDHVKDYDIDVCVTTNATNTSNKWFQTLKKLKNEPEIWLSIDAAGEVNDFQRKGSVWSSVKDNIIKYRDEFYEGSSKLSIQLTASAINFTTLDVWWDELMELNIPIHSSPVIHPVEYNLGAIPDKFKEAQVIWLDNWLLEKPRHWRQKREVKEAINILRSNPYSKEKQQLFKSEVTSLDSWRNESIIELDYRFKEILDA
jgi:sulfatase maturation enzyme AslB (radical SAM superfamily)